MPLDLLHFNPANPDPHWMYAHATLQRLFRATPDGRQQFWAEVPGFKRALSRANIIGNFNKLDFLLAHFLVELEDGWLNILGGTEWPTGWPFHGWSLVEVPTDVTDYFGGYFHLVGQRTLQDIDLVIDASDARPIMFSGHSLGGAGSLAAAYKDFARATARTKTAVTFGCPMSRSRQGMDGRDFFHARIWNEADVVPSLPQHVVKVSTVIVGGLVKLPLFSLYHYGLGLMVNKEGAFEIHEGSALRRTGLGAAILAITAFNGVFDPFVTHYIDSYALFCRMVCQRQGIAIDPFWDKVNAYINTAVGLSWTIPGFPLAAAPAQTVTPPPTVFDLTASINQVPDFRSFSADLLNPRPSVPLLTGQSLAGYLTSNAGADLADVTIHLSQAPIADPLNVDVTSFTECDFSGYQYFGGAEWVAIQPQNWTPARRFAARAVFRCFGQERPNTAYAWYALGHKNGSGDKVLLDWSNLGQPFAFDRPRALVIEFSLAVGPA